MSFTTPAQDMPPRQINPSPFPTSTSSLATWLQLYFCCSWVLPYLPPPCSSTRCTKRTSEDGCWAKQRNDPVLQPYSYRDVSRLRFPRVHAQHYRRSVVRDKERTGTSIKNSRQTTLPAPTLALVLAWTVYKKNNKRTLLSVR